ncbi:MAG: restriction endonuclease subunit S [Cyclobacteriaceae bacterium]|jgi:type I restriction enzyme S subunit|nr:restriction endonuclease subunit S [Flammeovirgaceae bacterium]
MEVMQDEYVRTEVGLVPGDWQVRPIRDLLTFIGGSQPDRSYFRSDEKEGYIRLVQIRDYKGDKYITFIPSHLARRFCEVDDIMIGRYGPPIFQILRGIKGAYNVALIKAVPSSIVTKEFCWYVLNQESLFNFVEKLSQRSSGQTGVDLNELRNYNIPFPPTIEEQTAIATALSDADALITALEKLIAKKRAIKQGVMQKLLQPKAGWFDRKVKDIGEIVTGSTPPTLKSEYWNGSVPWVTPTDITDMKDISDSERKITGIGLKVSRKLPANTLLVTCIASIGKNAVLRKEGACNQQINAVIPNNENHVDFLYYLIEANKQYLLGKAGITATLMISKKDFSEIKFSVPSLTEQARIADILNEIETEIVVLEKKLSKQRQLKQGMMQNLLTGKIRLV